MLGAMFDFDIPPNVYVGATIANQEEWTRDVSKVAQVAVLIGKHRTFLSMEPLLGPINLDDSGHYRWQGIIGFVIVGGESGTGARPMHPAWPLEIGDQCWQAGVRFHFKQWGEWIAPEDMDPAVRAGLRAGRSAPTVHQFPDGLTMMRVGTAKAGRLLAGREWQELPA
jgi:protein gp37